MSTNLLTLYSGDSKHISTLHNYEKLDSYEDVILIVDQRDKVNYITVDSTSQEITNQKTIRFIKVSKDLIRQQHPKIQKSDLAISKIMGVYKKESLFDRSVLFVVFNESKRNTNYVIQVNINDHDTDNPEVTLVSNHQETTNIYFDVLVQNTTVINDQKTVTSTDTYLMYLQFQNNDNSGDIGASKVLGTRVLMSDDEKVDFSEKTGITLPATGSPVVDTWTPNGHLFYQLTDDTKEINFNFSRGMGFIEFK